MRFFNLDSPFMMFLTKMANLMILTFLTLICCLPVITGGAAITALYYVSLKMAHGEDPYIVKNYFKSFRQNFVQATLIWLIMLAAALLLAADWHIVLHIMTGKNARIMMAAILAITIFLLMTGLYVFPTLSRFENPIFRTIKNAFLMSILNLPKSILILLIHLLPIVVVLISPRLIPLVFCLGIGMISYLSSLLFVKIFGRFEPQPEPEGDPDELPTLSFILEEEEEKKKQDDPQ